MYMNREKTPIESKGDQPKIKVTGSKNKIFFWPTIYIQKLEYRILCICININQGKTFIECEVGQPKVKATGSKNRLFGSRTPVLKIDCWISTVMVKLRWSLCQRFCKICVNVLGYLISAISCWIDLNKFMLLYHHLYFQSVAHSCCPKVKAKLLWNLYYIYNLHAFISVSSIHFLWRHIESEVCPPNAKVTNLKIDFLAFHFCEITSTGTVCTNL